MNWVATSVFLVIAAASNSDRARADIYNRALIPLGEREAFMGNAGTGDPRDTGAVYYNPAGLAGIEGGRVSVTGSVYLSFSNRYDAITRVDNTAIPYSTSGFNTIPATYVAEVDWGSARLAFSALVPDSLQFDNRTSFTTTNTAGTFIQSIRTDDLWLGASLAVPINEQWSLGWTLFGIRHSESSIVSIVFNVPAAANRAAASEARIAVDAFGFALTMGAIYRPARWVSLGLRVQSPLVQVTGSADAFSSGLTVINGAVTVAEEDKKDTKALYRIPLDVTLGTMFRVGSDVNLAADASIQLGQQYNAVPDSTLGSNVLVNPNLRLNFGAELAFAHSFPVRLGFVYNPSALHDFVDNNSNQTSIDYLGVTAGVAYVSKHVETGVGAFYFWGSGRTNPTAVATDVVSASSKGVGALLTTAYRF